MLEKDLQNYLFENPDILFPGLTVSEKRQEFSIEGRRIDLLYEIEGTRYIVELKRDAIKREDIGQILEYYGLMRRAHATASFKMILVAPSIPDYRRIPLEEFGIRCVEVPYWPESANERVELLGDVVKHQSRKGVKDAATSDELVDITQLNFEDFVPPVTPLSLRLSHQLLRDGLLDIERAFSAEYEIKPIRMENSQHVLCFPETDSDVKTHFVRAGAWWAYSFGHSEEVPKNDVPNISVNALPWGLDFAINAELRTSQEVMRRRIASQPERFDRLVLDHGSLRLQAWLKLEHQPRIFHWIPLVRKAQGSWRGHDLLGLHRQTELDFVKVREELVEWIKNQRPDMTAKQIGQMERTNRSLNLAWRLVHSFEREDPLWNLPYEKQRTQFGIQYQKLKPLIDFFQ
ncbi:MAG: endonuclease NucS domain-containing protein [Acidobacteriaceae bacterium]